VTTRSDDDHRDDQDGDDWSGEKDGDGKTHVDRLIEKLYEAKKAEGELMAKMRAHVADMEDTRELIVYTSRALMLATAGSDELAQRLYRLLDERDELSAQRDQLLRQQEHIDAIIAELDLPTDALSDAVDRILSSA
jgi:hypothetical protein